MEIINYENAPNDNTNDNASAIKNKLTRPHLHSTKSLQENYKNPNAKLYVIFVVKTTSI